MKIGLVSQFMPPHRGGLDRIGENLFLGYRRKGCEVRWVASRIPRASPRSEEGRTRVPCFNLAEDLLGIPVPLWGPTGWAEVVRLAEWADALHVIECLYLPSLMGVVAARRAGKPALLLQNVGFIPYRFALINWVERAAYLTLGRAVLRGASHLLLATPAAETYVDALLGGRPANVSAFPIGIDTDRFRPPADGEREAVRERLRLGQGKPVVLFAGRLVEKKGLPIVIAVSRRLPSVFFLVVGDGPLRTLLRNAPDNVLWRNDVAADEMAEYYKAADCVMLPSHGEGLPLVVQEAMATGLPVVISEDEQYAAALVAADVCMAAKRSTETMAERVVDALGDQARPLGERARLFANAHWSVETMVTRCLDILGDLLAART
jgi:glycosyltransferase involved in cell wall biosynthesis